MKTKIYISVLLTFTLLVKFVVEVNGLNILLSQNDITLIKLNCKPKDSSNQANQTAEFSQTDLSLSQVIASNSFCNSQFQFELYSWETNLAELTTVFDDYFTSNFSYRYVDNVSPPPRLA